MHSFEIVTPDRGIAAACTTRSTARPSRSARSACWKNGAEDRPDPADPDPALNNPQMLVFAGDHGAARPACRPFRRK